MQLGHTQEAIETYQVRWGRVRTTGVEIRTVDGDYMGMSGVSRLLLVLSVESSCIFHLQEVLCLTGVC